MTPSSPRTLVCACAAVLLSIPAVAADVTTKGIYGPDDRREPDEVSSSRIKGWADSTVALFQADGVKTDDKTKQAALTSHPFSKAGVKTPDNPFGEWVELCADEKYKGQGQGAFCSGIAPSHSEPQGSCLRTLLLPLISMTLSLRKRRERRDSARASFEAV